MELICTHQGCDLSGSIGASAIICPCHEAGFTLTGLVAQGPARSNLTHYKVTIGASGDITVDAGTLVAAGTRATV
jgi:Rieske Fe-S protein